MRSLEVGEIEHISGGFFSGEELESDPSMRFNDGGSDFLFDGGGAGGEGGDQRNELQIKEDNVLKSAKKACDLLPIGSTPCTKMAEAVNYDLQSAAYTSCKSAGGSDGPNDCGAKPTPPKP